MTTTNDRAAWRDLPRVRPQDLGIGVLFWSIRDGVVVGDAASGRVVLWSPSAETLFGYPAEEIVGQPIEVLVPDACKEEHRAGALHRHRPGNADRRRDAGGTARPAQGHHRDCIEWTLGPITAPSVGG